MAGSSDFVQFNPNQNNQESTQAYASDAITTGGFGTGSIVPGQWLNKFCYDQSTFAAAINNMLASKGYAVSSGDLAALTGVYANFITRADQRTPLVQVPFSPNPQFDASRYDGFQMTITGNVTPTIVGQSPGQIIKFIVVQDGAGNHTWNWAANIVGGGIIATAANFVSIQSFVVDVSNILRPLTAMTVS